MRVWREILMACCNAYSVTGVKSHGTTMILLSTSIIQTFSIRIVKLPFLPDYVNRQGT